MVRGRDLTVNLTGFHSAKIPIPLPIFTQYSRPNVLLL